MTTGIIYKITCNVTNMSYVGQTIQPLKKRIQQHKDDSSYCRLLSGAIKEHGWDTFETNVIWEGPHDSLCDMEKQLIKENDTMAPNGYNLREGGGRSERVSEESKRLMVEKQREVSMRRSGLLGSIKENKSKLNGHITSWTFKSTRNGKSYKIKNCKTKEEALKIQQEFTNDPDGYVIPESTHATNGNARGVYYNKKRRTWATNVGNTYLGSYDTEEKAKSVVDQYRKDPSSIKNILEEYTTNNKRNDRENIGVSYHNGKGNWMASIHIDKKNRFLGNYSTQEEAIDARKRFIENPDTFVRPNQRKKIKL